MRKFLLICCLTAGVLSTAGAMTFHRSPQHHGHYRHHHGHLTTREEQKPVR